MLGRLAKDVGLGAAIGLICGAASALFLFLLELATQLRTAHETLVYGLPLAGLALGFVYERVGQRILPGSNLVIDTIHDEGPEIPLRMAPLVLVGTVLTHLFGGSAGREGTAVQMGASLSDFLAHRLRLSPDLRQRLLVSGVAGGFGSVFGTPLAGAAFGMEFVVLGKLRVDALVPALVASFVGDAITRALGIAHTPYPRVAPLPVSLTVLGQWLLFALAVAVVVVVFIELTHALKRFGARHMTLPLRMLVGGALVVSLWQLVGTSDYLGLGVPVIERAFQGTLAEEAFALKLLFTAITLGAGFLGGEVTPLFFVGAALGNTLSGVLGLPLELAVAVGLCAVFGAAANTPMALSIMAVELFGTNVFPHVVLVCLLAYALSGKRSIYGSQIRRPEHGDAPRER